MKIALLKNYPTDSEDLEEQFKSVGLNSGNIVYWEAIIRLFNPDIVSFGDSDKFSNYDAVIITDLCWIRENVEYGYIENLVDKFNIPFIPMSIGLQNNDFNPNFKLSEQLVRTLKKMQKRAVLGVRGEYTASILRKHGITNIAVIGCPSMYYWNNRELKIEDNGTPVNVCCNFKSFDGKLSSEDVSVLEYFDKNNFLFVEQTKRTIEDERIENKKLSKKIKKYTKSNILLEFYYSAWAERLKEYNFSLGCRYHGNIIALQQNMKALFITIDSRTQEMINLFHLPFIKKDDFDTSKSIDYYFKLADYTEFNKIYPKMYDRFLKFATDNKLEISKKAKPITFTAKTKLKKIDMKRECDKEENAIYLRVQKDGNAISYDVEIVGDWKDCFNIRKKFSVEYDCNIENVPNSIAILPILSVVLPVSWLEDATIYVDEIDEDFLECIDNVKRNYAFMLPHYTFAGKLKFRQIVKNNISHLGNKTLCLFSGGVDATSTLLNNLNFNPTLLTIWGTDIPLTDSQQWSRVKEQTMRVANEFNLPHTFVKTSFRYLLNEYYLTKRYQSWWHDLQHGIALLCQVAPYAYINNISNVIIAATHSAKDDKINVCASQAFLDENVKYAGCRVFHDLYQMSRMDKIRFIADYSKKHNQKFNLRVCWCQYDELNCCVCEKCARTIFALYAIGVDPKDFGFDITKEKEEQLINNLLSKKIFLNDFFNEVRDMLVKNREKHKGNKLIETFLSLYKEDGNIKNNFIETNIQKIGFSDSDYSKNFFNKKTINILNDINLNSVGDGISTNWKTVHSRLASFDKTKKMLICGKEANVWNILSQKIDFKNLKGEELTLCVKSKSLNYAKLNIFARYIQKDGQIKYLSNCTVQNCDEYVEYMIFSIPNNIPEDAELSVGVYLNEPSKEVLVSEIKLLRFC